MPAAKPERKGQRKDPGAVLCAICRKGIHKPADLAIKGRDVMHLRCYEGKFRRPSN